MCGRMFHEELDEVEKYVGGLPDMIRGGIVNVISTQDDGGKALQFANDQIGSKSPILMKDKLSAKEKVGRFNAGNNSGTPTTNKRAKYGMGLHCWAW
ncbi:hypothetical protein Tco_0484432 [Tanacetum coccineum]